MTQKRLILMRHGEAEGHGHHGDHQRELTDVGRQQAVYVGSKLLELNWLPDMIFASDSKRTRQTCQYLQKAASLELTPLWISSFYLGNYGDILRELSSCECLKRLETVLVVGHNPGWSEAITWLSGDMVALGTGEAALLAIDYHDWIEALYAERLWKSRQMIGL